MHRQHEHARLRDALANDACGPRSVRSGMLLSIRITCGRRSTARCTASRPLRTLSNDLDAALRAEQVHKPSATNLVIVGDEDADGHGLRVRSP